VGVLARVWMMSYASQRAGRRAMGPCSTVLCAWMASSGLGTAVLF